MGRREGDREGEGDGEGSLQNNPKNLDPSNMLDLYLCDSELQIRGDIENNSKICHISEQKHMLFALIRIVRRPC